MSLQHEFSAHHVPGAVLSIQQDRPETCPPGAPVQWREKIIIQATKTIKKKKPEKGSQQVDELLLDKVAKGSLCLRPNQMPQTGWLKHQKVTSPSSGPRSWWPQIRFGAKALFLAGRRLPSRCVLRWPFPGSTCGERELSGVSSS